MLIDKILDKVLPALKFTAFAAIFLAGCSVIIFGTVIAFMGHPVPGISLIVLGLFCLGLLV